MIPQKNTNLVQDFWKLSPTQRRNIIHNLGLYEESDDLLPEVQRCKLAFERAAEQEKISELIENIKTLTERIPS